MVWPQVVLQLSAVVAPLVDAVVWPQVVDVAEAEVEKSRHAPQFQSMILGTKCTIFESQFRHENRR